MFSFPTASLDAQVFDMCIFAFRQVVAKVERKADVVVAVGANNTVRVHFCAYVTKRTGAWCCYACCAMGYCSVTGVSRHSLTPMQS